MIIDMQSTLLSLLFTGIMGIFGVCLLFLEEFTCIPHKSGLPLSQSYMRLTSGNIIFDLVSLFMNILEC